MAADAGLVQSLSCLRVAGWRHSPRNLIQRRVLGRHRGARGSFPVPQRQTKETRMLKFIGGTIGIIFLIGLAVVVGLLMLIF